MCSILKLCLTSAIEKLLNNPPSTLATLATFVVEVCCTSMVVQIRTVRIHIRYQFILI